MLSVPVGLLQSRGRYLPGMIPTGRKQKSRVIVSVRFWLRELSIVVAKSIYSPSAQGVSRALTGTDIKSFHLL